MDQNGQFTVQNPVEMDDLGVPPFQDTSICPSEQCSISLYHSIESWLVCDSSIGLLSPQYIGQENSPTNHQPARVQVTLLQVKHPNVIPLRSKRRVPSLRRCAPARHRRLADLAPVTFKCTGFSHGKTMSFTHGKLAINPNKLEKQKNNQSQ